MCGNVKSPSAKRGRDGARNSRLLSVGRVAEWATRPELDAIKKPPCEGGLKRMVVGVILFCRLPASHT